MIIVKQKSDVHSFVPIWYFYMFVDRLFFFLLVTLDNYYNCVNRNVGITVERETNENDWKFQSRSDTDISFVRTKDYNERR